MGDQLGMRHLFQPVVQDCVAFKVRVIHQLPLVLIEAKYPVDHPIELFAGVDVGLGANRCELAFQRGEILFQNCLEDTILGTEVIIKRPLGYSY